MRVFVSSTFRDLKEERQAVRNVINELAKEGYDIQWMGMEEFGPQATTPLKTSIGFAAQADLVILLVADSYGSVPPDGKHSFTDEEYKTIRRNKIPCLAYFAASHAKDDNKKDNRIEQFRSEIKKELTVSDFYDKDHLEREVRNHLERQLKAFRPKTESHIYNFSPPSFDPKFLFADREDKLRELEESMADEIAYIGVWGPTGIGKTTFVQHFFLSNRNKKLYDDPIWLRVDDLFGRDPAGHLEIGAVRWNKEDLLDQLIKLNEKKPRAIIVFDNVQAAPLDVCWLATKLRDSRDVQMIFLSWDKEALPPTRTIIHLDTLPFSASQQIIFHYCSPEQAQDKKGIQDLCRLLDDHPLLLDLAGRQLNLLSSSLSVAELVSSLKDRIALEGPTIDREHVQVETVLRESYHCLEFHERQVLGSLAIAPSRGISQETMNWMITRLRGQDQTTRLDRAEHLGLLESRMKPDWHGHRYCLRPLIAEFLQTTDAFRESRIKFEEYLSSREALKDSSSDIVVLALERQLKELLLLEFPDNREWLDMLAVDARSEMRSRVHNVLINIKDQQQIIALQDALLEILKTPRPEEITVELIQLIGHWDTSSARQGLERLWLRPLCSTDDEYEKDPELSRDIRAEASNFLAKLEGKSLADFLIQYIRGLDHKRRNASLDTAAHRECTEALPAIFDLLKHTNPRIRQTAVDALGDYINSPEVSDQLWELFQNDLDDEVKYRTAMALGVRGDKRILPYLLSKLMDMNADADIRAETCSVFWNYKPQDLPLDRLAEVAVHDPDMNTRVNTTVILVSFGDERGAEPILQLLRASDNKQRRYGVHFVSMAETGTPLYDALRRAAIDILVENFLNSSEIGLRLLARAALLHLRDKRGYQGLWTDVRYDASSKFIDTYRWFVISQFAEWVPPDFDPIHLRSLIHDQDPKMRKIAALVTGQVGARVLIKDLETLLEDHSKPLDDEKTVAEYASEALDRIAGKRERWKPFPPTKKFS